MTTRTVQVCCAAIVFGLHFVALWWPVPIISGSLVLLVVAMLADKLRSNGVVVVLGGLVASFCVTQHAFVAMIAMWLTTALTGGVATRYWGSLYVLSILQVVLSLWIFMTVNVYGMRRVLGRWRREWVIR